MIATDTNLLVYAHRRDSPWHQGASQSIRSLAEGRQPWGVPWPCLHEFFAIVRHPRIYDPPSTIKQSIAQIELGHGVTELWTADRDFGRFPQLSVRNPLAGR